MLEPLGTDENEAKKCNDHDHGKKFKSYRKGLKAGKRDGRRKTTESLAANPYKLTEEMWKLLQQRARWKMGYDLGYQLAWRKKSKKEPKELNKKKKKGKGKKEKRPRD